MKAQFETVPREDDSSFACVTYRGADFDCPYHFHPECEILRIDSSHGNFLIGDTFGEFRPGQWFLFGEGLPHLFQNDPAPRGQSDWARSRVIQFRPDCLGAAFFNRSETRHLARFLDRARRGLSFGDGVEPRASRLLARVFRERGLARLLAWLELLQHLAAHPDARPITSASYRPTEDQSGFQRLARALETIHRHYGEALDQSRLARSVGLSPSAFSHAFRRYLNMPFSRYLNTYRISRVRRELIETDDPVTEIAFRNGYNNLSHFNRQFLREAGSSPRLFRKRVRHLREPAHTPPPD